MATAVDQSEARPPQPSGWSWSRLLIIAAIAAVVGIGVILILSGLIPPLIIFALLFIAGVIVMRTRSRAGVIMLLVISILFLASNVPFIIPALAVPASAVDFIVTVYLLVATIIAIVSSIALLRDRDRAPGKAPRMLGSAAAVVVLLAIVGSVVASVTYDSAEAQSGDIRLVAEAIEFSEESLQSDNSVSVFVKNNDLTLHTFTIDELDVDVDIPAGKSARVTFDAEPGSYTYYCVPHESEMKGSLEVQ